MYIGFVFKDAGIFQDPLWWLAVQIASWWNIAAVHEAKKPYNMREIDELYIEATYIWQNEQKTWTTHYVSLLVVTNLIIIFDTRL